MPGPLLLYLDQTGEGLPDEYGDGIYGEFVYGSDLITPTDVGERTIPVSRGVGGNAFGSSAFGTGTNEQVAVSRVIRPQDRHGLNYRRVRTDTGDWEVEVPGDFELHDWIEADAFILDSEGVRFRGTVWDFDHDEQSNVVRLTGPGPLGRLSRGSAAVTYNSQPTWEAFRDYLLEHVPEWSVNVEEPDVEELVNFERVQDVDGVRDDLEQATSITETDPFHIVDGAIEPAQTCFTMDATDTTARDVGGSSDPDAGERFSEVTSQGRYVLLQDVGDRVEYTFEPDHTIPQARIGLRWDAENAPQVEIGFDGVDENAMTVTEGGEGGSLRWSDLRQFGNDMRNISSETTVVIEVTGAGGGGSFFVDVVAPRDLRYDVTFDNEGIEVSGATYLQGPEWYPQEAQLVTDRIETDNNVSEAFLQAFFDDVGNQQAIEMSNDDGGVWRGQPRSSGVIAQFDNFSYGYGIQARFTFSWYDRGEVLATPRRGRRPQRLSGWTFDVSMNDLSVVEEVELTESHLSNIMELADRAGIRFHVPPNTQTIEAFHRRQRQDSLQLYDPELDIDRDELTGVYNHSVYNAGFYGSGVDPPDPGFKYESLDSSKSTGTDYANVVIVRGATVDGERVTGEARDETEIEALSRFGRDSTAVHVHSDASITTQTDAEAVAEEMLTEMMLERDFDGSVSGLPRDILDAQGIHPGIEYYVDRWQLYSTLEEVYVDDDGVDLDFQGAKADQIISGIKEARRRANLIHRAL